MLGGDEHVFTLLLALFSIGIGVGSLLCERLSGRKVEIGLVPFGSIGLTLFAIDLWLATRGMHATGHAAASPRSSRVAAHWRVAADIVLLGVFGGFYIVPLYALIQARSQPSHRSRIIAANNILNALFMVVSAVVAIGAAAAPACRSRSSSWSSALMNALVARYIYTLVPEFLMRFLAWLLDPHVLPRAAVEGLENIPDEGPCVVVCNHVSYVDAVVIAACVRRPIRFVMDHRIFRVPLLSFIFRTMRAIPIAPAREDPAMKDRAFAEAAAALARRRDRRHLSRRASSRDTGEHQSVSPRRPADPRDDAGARRADGAARAVGQLLLARRREGADAPLPRHLLADRARRSAGRACRRGDARCAVRARAARCAATSADRRDEGERGDADRDDVAGCSGRNDDRAGPRRCTCRRFRRSYRGAGVQFVAEDARRCPFAGGGAVRRR